MGEETRGSEPRTAPTSGDVGRTRTERNTRMAWSMTAAVAVHAAALASWGRLPQPFGPDGAFDPAAAQTQPEWIFLDQSVSIGPDGGVAAGTGAASRPPASELPASSESRADGEGAVPPDPAGLPHALRDRLVGATAFGPTLTGDEGAGGIPTVDGVAAARAGGSSTASLSAVEQQSLQGLTALDLERLAGVRPEVALEAFSYWVLVRNAAEVQAFMERNAAPQTAGAGEPGSVSVALWVSAGGAVEWAEVITSSGRSDWDDLALTLFSQVVTFRPARLDGLAMPVSAIFTVNFPWL